MLPILYLVNSLLRPVINLSKNIRGRKRIKPIEAGRKCSIILPSDIQEDYLKIIKEIESQKGSLNAALFYFLELGFNCYLKQKQKGNQQFTIHFKGLDNNQIDAVVNWLSQSVSQRAVEQLLLYIVFGKPGSFSDLISEINETNKKNIEQETQPKGSAYSKNLIDTGFY